MPTLLFGAIFAPSANPLVDERAGPRPAGQDRSLGARRDLGDLRRLVDGEWRPLTGGALRGDAVRDGMDRGSAARIGGMDPQTLRDWVHRFNAAGPDGLLDNWTERPKPRLSVEQLAGRRLT